MDLNDFDLIIFDLDGTLTQWQTGEILPGVREWFIDNGDRFDLAIASNQGGVGLRYWMEASGFGDPEKYPTEDDFWQTIQQLVDQVPQAKAATVFVCFSYTSKKGNTSPTPPDGDRFEWDLNQRKPFPGMLQRAMRLKHTPKDRTLMVGDRDEDHGAAINAGCQFMHADQFFNRAGAGG